MMRMAIPGNAVSHHASKIYSLPFVRMFPQLGFGGCTPNPRKLRPASRSTAVASPIVAVTKTGARALGRICRKMILRLPAPRLRAAVP